jgi:hypothetical protein
VVGVLFPTPFGRFYLKKSFLEGKLIVIKKYLDPKGYTHLQYFGYVEKDGRFLNLPL